MSECEKCQEMDPTYCFDGQLYGGCASEWCGGGCEDYGPCDCECHSVAEGDTTDETVR